MQISLPRRVVFKTSSPQEEAERARQLFTQYSWSISRGIFRFFISGIVAFFIAVMSFFSWNGSVKNFTVPFFSTDGGALIGIGQDLHEFSANERLSAGMTLRTDKASRFSLLFLGKNIVRLDRNTEVVIRSFSPDSLDGVFLDLDLAQGSLWINTMMSENSIHVSAGELSTSIANATALVTREDGNLSVYSDRHAVSGTISSAQFLVPQGLLFTIRESDVTGKINQLRYSKFKKEFFRFLPEQTVESDEWMVFNRQKDALVFQDARILLSELISAQKFFTFSEASTAGIFQKYYYEWGNVFIVSKEEEKAFQIDRFLLPFHKAEKFFQDGDEKNGVISLQIFLDNFAVVTDQRDVVLDSIRTLEGKYAVVSPDDALYPLKTALRTAEGLLIVFEAQDVKNFDVFRERLYEVFDLVFDGKNTEAKRSFLSYKNDLLNVLRDFSPDFSLFQSHFFSEYELLYQLLSENAFFYDSKYFTVFSPLEKILVSSASNDVDGYEIRLTFISNKLRMLEKLAYLLKGNSISRSKALPLGKMLLDESNAMLADSKTYDVAVFGLFSDKISSLSQLFRFFESGDFSILYDGVYSEESFREFQETEKYLEELRAYLKNLSSSTSSRVQRVNVDDFLRRVRSDFVAYDIVVKNIEPLEEMNYRLFSIGSGSVGGKTFRAKYDREYQLVYDVTVDSSEVVIDGVHLRNLASFVAGLEKSSVEVSGDDISDGEEIVKPRSQEEENFIRVALKSLEQRDIVYNIEDVVVLDLPAKRFWIGRAVYKDAEDLVFSFEFDLGKGSVTKVSVETSFGSKEISGTYALSNLLEAVKGAEGVDES